MLKFCSCRACRRGRHCARSKVITRRSIRSNRRKTKVDLRHDREPTNKISIPYTD